MIRPYLFRHAAALLLLTLCLLPASGALAIDLRFVEIINVVQLTDGVESGAYFLIELEDNDMVLANATFTPPGGTPLALDPQPGEPGRFEKRFDFDSLAELRAMFPLGSYDFSFDSGTLTGSVVFDHAAPDGFVTFSSPVHLETDVPSQPTAIFTNSCTNCNTLFLRIDGQELEEDLPLGATMVLLPPLADGMHTLGGSTGLDTEAFPSFGSDVFDYGEIFINENNIKFTVPEPSRTVLAVAALATLGVLMRRGMSTDRTQSRKGVGRGSWS